MSKRVKQQRPAPVPLIALAIAGVLLVAAAIFWLAPNNGGDGTPVMTVDQKIIDYGDVEFNTPMSFQIKVSNTGDGVLRFKEAPYIQVLEGC